MACCGLCWNLDGELITKAEPDGGFSASRGDEKIAENMTYTQFIPYTDRLDYLSRRWRTTSPTRSRSEDFLGIHKIAAALPIHSRHVR